MAKRSRKRYWIDRQIQGALGAGQELGPREVSQRILDVIPEIPGLELNTGMDSEQETEDKNLERVYLFGEDSEQLDEIAEGLEDVFLRVPGVLGIKKASERAPNELALVVDRDRADWVTWS